jgi:glycine hydroxymethyltransferase
VCFLEAATAEFRTYQRQVMANAKTLAATLADEGFRVVSGGTDSHMLLIDVFAKGVKGKEAEKVLDEAYITVNKNAIPFDVNPPLNPSGVRLGTPAVTTRGFLEEDMTEVGRLIAYVLSNAKSEEAVRGARERVGKLTAKYPLYAWKQHLVAAH